MTSTDCRTASAPPCCLHHIGGLSDGELARAMHVPLGTAKSRIRLGTRRARAVVQHASPPERTVIMARVLVMRETDPRPPALEVAVSHALVERVSAGAVGPVLRVYRPAPTLAFGRLDAIAPGFAAAAAAARAHGFEPVVRAPGGHAVAYHDGCLVVDELIPAEDPIAGLQDRFAQSGEWLAEALRTPRSRRRVGRVDGEFCPGDFTVSARGRVKLVGTAQRSCGMRRCSPRRSR